MTNNLEGSNRRRRAALAPLCSAAAVVALLSGAMPPPAQAADGSYDRVKAAGLVACGTDGLLPYSSSDEKYPGFEVEIARAIAKELGTTVSYAWLGWDGLIPALQAKRCDAIMMGMFITEARKKIVDFSIPYYGSGETILVQKDNTSIKTLDDLKGKKVGVLAGTVSITYLPSKGVAGVVVLPDQATILLELSNGRLDAAYLEAPSSAWVVRHDKFSNIRLVESYVPEDRYNAGVALRKEDQDLKARIDDALRKLLADGTIAGILAKYGVPYYPPAAS